MSYTLINSLQELKSICIENGDEYVECFILLQGLFRSSKRVLYDQKENTFSVHNEIDDSYQDDLTEEQLKTDTMIIEAIEKKALFLY